MSFADRDCRQDIQKAVEDVGGGLAEGRSRATRIGISGRWFAVVADALGEATERADGEGGPEHLEIVVIDLVLEPVVPRLIEASNLIEVDRLAIGEQQPLKRHG